MEVHHTIQACRDACRRLPILGFVPTMGALHQGHLSLVKYAKAISPNVALSIFVNPTQFAPHEDFSRYPRPVERDLELCRSAGVSVVFMPSADEMYPAGSASMTIDLPQLTSTLEGAVRPGHFAGVCTVVAKLLNIVNPTSAYFGEKDFQQFTVVSAMVRALNMPVSIVGCTTLRDPDGLAMSSRNQYLSSAERTRALSISRSLRTVQQSLSQGETNCQVLKKLMRSILEKSESEEVPVEVQYATVIDPTTLREVEDVSAPARAVVAMKVGATRLIDNMELLPKGSSKEDKHAS